MGFVTNELTLRQISCWQLLTTYSLRKLKHNPMKLITHLLFVVMLMLFIHNTAISQISIGGQPNSFSLENRLPELVSEYLPSLDMDKIDQQDEQNPGNTRFAAPVMVNFNMNEDGSWSEMEDGSRIWRLKLSSNSALGLGIFYDDFYLPDGAQLFVYSPDQQQVLGAYTSVNNQTSERFFTGFIKGNTAIIEYYEPAYQRGRGRLHVFRVDQAYHKVHMDASQIVPGRNPLAFGFGTALGCHENANCSEGDDWDAQRRSVCRIMMALEEGTGYCTGTLMNNTNEDETPYILSAFHCDNGYTPLHDLWRFDFDYQSANCNDPTTEPTPNSILGCVLRAGKEESDFQLLEINGNIPSSYNVSFAGWNRDGIPPQNGVNFHHASGDIKKVALYNEPAVVHSFAINWGTNITPPDHHFRLNYSLGSFQQGSSGSALFNQDGVVVGQLHGGLNGDCDGVPTLYFGRLSISWDDGSSADNRLSDWLDPLGLGVTSLDKLEPAGGITMSGTIANESGAVIANAKIILSGSTADTTYTDQNGQYSFSGIPTGMPLGINVSKEDNPQNGCSTLDLIKISQHILGVEQLGSPYKLLASDANASGTLTPLDQIAIRKVILSIETSFPGKPNWQFFPGNYSFPDPTDPFDDLLPDTFFINNFTTDIIVNFIGIKTGDIDDSAETGD